MTTMYDSDIPSAIPQDAQIVAGYIDGYAKAAWDNGGWARFPNALKVMISATGINDGHVLDIEPDNPPASFAPQWIRARQASGIARPVIYCGVNDQPGFRLQDVRKWCAGLDYDVWVADYTGRPHLYPGSVATQWADQAAGSGGHYDVSETVEGWPQSLFGQSSSGSSTFPTADSAMAGSVGGRLMFLFRNNDDGSEYLVAEKSVVHIGDPRVVALYAQVIPMAHGTTSDLNSLQQMSQALYPTTSPTS